MCDIGINVTRAMKSGYAYMLKQLYVFNLFQVGADFVRGLYKRKLELDVEYKKIKIAKLEKLEHEKKVIAHLFSGMMKQLGSYTFTRSNSSTSQILNTRLKFKHLGISSTLMKLKCVLSQEREKRN